MAEASRALETTSGPPDAVASLIVRDVPTCRPFDSVFAVARQMVEERMSLLPVLAADGSRRLLGLLTLHDVFVAVAEQDGAAEDLQVRSVMTGAVETCPPEATIEQALERMRGARVRQLPVVDGRRRLIGLLTLTAIARWVTRETSGAVPHLAREVCHAVAACAHRKPSSLEGAR